MRTKCSECDRPVAGRGMCKRHYQAVRRTVGFPPRPTLAERLDAKTDKSGDCWLWTGAIGTGGYGRIGIGTSKSALVHRVSYELAVGPIPPGLSIDHLCRTRHCLRPEHLEAVPQGVNIQRGYNARDPLTHCKRGHEFTPENTYRNETGHRGCLACRREYDARRWAIR